MSTSNVTIGPDSGWNGPHRHHTSEFGPLLAELRELGRRLSALERAAPLRASKITLDENGMYAEGVAEFTGPTSIAGVGMNTFIPQQQDLRSEVIDARGTWPDLDTRLVQIRIMASDAGDAASSAQSTASAVQSEVITARSSSGSLGARINAHKAALNNIIGVVNDIFDRLDDLDNKGLAPGTWPPPIPM